MAVTECARRAAQCYLPEIRLLQAGRRPGGRARAKLRHQMADRAAAREGPAVLALIGRAHRILDGIRTEKIFRPEEADTGRLNTAAPEKGGLTRELK